MRGGFDFDEVTCTDGVVKHSNIICDLPAHPEFQKLEVRDNSKYEVNIEETTVDGKNMVSVKLSNLPKTILTNDFDWGNYTIKCPANDITYWFHDMDLWCLASIFDVGNDKAMAFYTPQLVSFENGERKKLARNFKCAVFDLQNLEGLTFDFWTQYVESKDDSVLNIKNMVMHDDGATFSLEAYLEPDDEVVTGLKSLTKITVVTYAGLYGSFSSGWATGDYRHVVSIGSNGTVPPTLHHTSFDDIYGEKAKVTNVIYVDTPIIGEILTPATPVPPVTPEDTTSSETSSEIASSDTSNTTSTDTSETTSNDTDGTLTIVDKDTGVTVEISKEDTDLIDADFTVTPANHDTLLDLIKQIADKIIDTITDQVRKVLDEVADTVKNGKGFAYDMSFRKNGAEVQPDRKVTVTVPVPDEFKSDIDKLNVYHLTDKGAVFVPSWIKDGAVVFETDSFSPYVITVDKLTNAVGGELTSSAPESSTPNISTSDEVNNPYTGGFVTLFAPIAALAAVTVAAVTKKKK